MKRPVFLFFMGLVLGEVMAILLNRTGFFVMALFLLIAVLVYARIYKRLKKKRSPLFLYALLFCGSCFIGGLLFFKAACLNDIDRKLSSEALSGTLTGQIEFVKETQEGEYQLTLKDCFFLEEGKEQDFEPIGAKCRILKIPVSRGKVYPGDQIFCTGKLCAIESPSNPGQFDSKIYYYSLGIHYQFLGKTLTRKMESPLSVYRIAGSLRKTFDSVYSKVLSESEYGLLKAMFLGDKTSLSREQKSLYEENGVAHLLAVSGLHVSIVGGMLFRFFRKRRCSYAFSCAMGSSVLLFYAIMTGFGNSVFRAVIMFLCFLTAQYFGVEYDMVSSMSLAGILMLFDSPWRLLESGCIISFVSIFAIGMVLPFAKELKEKRSRQRLMPGEFPIENVWKRKWKEAFFANLILSMAIVPLLLRFYYQWSPYSLVLNLFVIPAMSPLLLSAIAGGVLGLVHLWTGTIGCIPAVVLLRAFNWIFHLIRRLPGSVIVTGYPPWWGIALLYFIFFLCFLIWYYRFWNGGIILLFFLLSGIFFYPERPLTITMLDVGQGESILMKMPSGETVLVDGGSTSRQNVAEYVILPALKYYGTDHLDYVIITHTDEDHISGIRELLENEYPIKAILLSDTAEMNFKDIPDDIAVTEFQNISGGMTATQKRHLSDDTVVTNQKDTLDNPRENLFLNQIKKSKIPVVKLGRGDSLHLKQVKLSCLYPEKGQVEEDANSASLVFFLSYERFTMVFTGDIPGEKESLLKEISSTKDKNNHRSGSIQSDTKETREIRQSTENHLKLQMPSNTKVSATTRPLKILKIAHHGSKNSTTEAFLKRFCPEKAILSAGKNNLYGHPHEETIKRVQKVGADIYGTLWGGAIVIDSDGQEYSIHYFNKNKSIKTNKQQ